MIIQAIVFGDGGITAIGANCFNMAVVMPFVSYWTFRLVGGESTKGPKPYVAAFFSGYAGLSVAAILTAIEFGIQPIIAQGADGRPLYGPYPLSIAVPAMALEHLFLFSVLEGAVTLLLLKYFLKYESGLIYTLRTKEG
ncbi:MAG: Fused nickel transport protein NikMN [Syntrophorhabdus sp. PtaB.Bin006]|nr:MAG: Fused nickel transport protein NikMN [Syntrophorhabdus sp. PtaB.Bin006]